LIRKRYYVLFPIFIVQVTNLLIYNTFSKIPPSTSMYFATRVRTWSVARLSSSRPVILNGCAARFARRAAKLSRRSHIEKIIKTISFNINFEKGTREKCSHLFSR
jgi:hypothetical protein